MIVKQAVTVDEKGRIEEYGRFTICAGHEEVRIITKALKVFLDYSPRSKKEGVDYESKKLAVEMVESINHTEKVKVEPQTDNGIGCSRCEGRFDCYDRDMPHAVHCNNYGKITDEPQTERSE